MVSETTIRSLGDRIGHVKALRNEYAWLLPLGWIMVDLIDVEKNAISGANVDAADVHVLAEATTIATNSRWHDTKRFVIAHEHVVKVVGDIDRKLIL